MATDDPNLFLLNTYTEKILDWEFHPSKDDEDPILIYKTKNLELAVNDFPFQPLYTLYEDGALVGSFDKWPANWHRPK